MLNSTLGIIKSMRIRDCLLVVIIGLIGFKFTNLPVNKLAILTLFSVITVTMFQNDWRDRVHDIRKGKKFPSKNPKLFLSWLIFFWAITGCLIAKLFLVNSAAGDLLLALALVGAVYSETRKIPLLSVALVTLTVASPLLLSLTFGGSFSNLEYLFFSIILIMFGRETLHDIADMNVDKGYKQTVPVFIGEKFARFISAASLIVGSILTVAVSFYAFLGVVFVLYGLTMVFSDTRLIKVRKYVDIGLMFLSLIILLF